METVSAFFNSIDWTLVGPALAVLCLLLMSAFFSGSETGLTAASRARMHHLENQGDERAELVGKLLERQERLIGAILLGNNLVNILASALATSIFLSLFGDVGVAYATLVMTALVLIFAEVLPKTYALANADRVALTVAPAIRACVYLFAPIVSGVQAIVRSTLRLLGADGENDFSDNSDEELRGTIDLHHKEGAVVKHDRDMLGGILDLKDIMLEELMVHRKNMFSIDANLPSEKIVEQMLASPYTRVPLWRDHPENIVAVLHAKDLARALHAAGGDATKIDVLDVAIEPWFVPESTMVRDQLNAFREKAAHFALVVDEYGGLMGLVTLEDILEEIVGEISDEHDIDVQGVRPQPDGRFDVDGTVPLRDLNRALEWDLPDDEATTLAGLVIHEAMTIPEPGQAFNFYGFKFEILTRERNQITSVRVTPPHFQEQS